MAGALEPEARFRRELYHEAEVGLGRVSLGLLNPEPQPIWNEDQTVGLVMEGELYDLDVIRQGLVEGGHHLATDSDAEVVLHLYEACGEAFAVQLNGAFALAIWDKRTRKLLVANDRLGLYPLYYTQTADGLAFASGVRALLADPQVPRRVDATAMAEFLTFDHVLHQRTLLQDVQLLPQATLLTCQAGQVKFNRYWKLEYPQLYPLGHESEYLHQLQFYLKQAIQRQAQKRLPGALLLSGGLDSRLLLGYMAEPGGNGQSNGSSNHRLTTFTWGIPGCDDARFARDAAARAGADHHFFELQPDWLLEHAENGVRLTDGMANVVNLHAMANLAEESQYAQVVSKGFLGDAMFGFALRPRFWADYDDATRLQVHLEAYRDYNVLSFDFPAHKHLMTDSFRLQVGSSVLDEYALAVNRAGTPQLSNQRLYADLTQRVPRMTVNGVEVVRSRMAVRLPFADNDLVEFAVQIPPGLQMSRHLITRACIEAFPELSQVPFTPSNLPLVACAREVIMRGQQLVRWHMRRRGLGRLAGPETRPYKDYNTWFRTNLRPWVEATLLNPHALDRGYFKPDFVRQLVQEHMAGTNHAVRLGELLALELWHKQYID